MPKNVGRYQQGGMATQPAKQWDGGGEPHRHPPAPPAPKNEPMKRDNGNTVGNNDGHKAH
jgi:hypothetical protein